jgi:hypothetical protein
MGLFKSLFGGPSESKSVTNPATVWEPQQKYLTTNYQRGAELARDQMAPGSNFQNMLGQQQGAWQNLLSGSANPYLSGMAGNAMAAISRQFQEQIMPALLGGGNAAGQLGGERYQGLQDSAQREAMDAIARAGTDVYGRAWDSGLQAQLEALNQSSQVQGAAWQPLLAQSRLVGSPTVLSGGGTQTTEGASGGLIGSVTNLLNAGKGTSGGNTTWFGQ